MRDSWAAQFVDREIHAAWLELRIRLADRLAEGLAADSMDPIDVSTATGESLTIEIDEEAVVIVAGSHVRSSENVDEAAHIVYRILHDRWNVVHPSFLDTDLVELPDLSDEHKTVVPSHGYADSVEQLRDWVVAAFSEGRDEPLVVDDDGDIPWRTSQGNRVYVRVVNRRRVQTWSVLASNVDVDAAHRLADRWSRKYLGLTFFVVEDRLVMSDCVYVWPFVPGHVTDPLLAFMATVDQLKGRAEAIRRPEPVTGLDPALVALLPGASFITMAELHGAVVAAAGSRGTLERWRTVAREQYVAARSAQVGGDPDVRRKLRNGWRRVLRAIDLALVVPRTSDAR